VIKLVKLLVHFILCFIGLFLIATGIRFLALRLEWTRLLTLQPESLQRELTIALQWALSFSFYCSIIIALCFISREKAFAPMAIIIIVFLSVGLTYFISGGLETVENMVSEKVSTKPIGGPGLILANPMRPNSIAVVMLDGPSRPGGARIVILPDRSMIYQESFPGKDVSPGIPLAPIGEESPWIFKSVAIDLKLSADHLWQLYKEGLFPFVVYTGALAVLLISFIFIMNLTAWPLANFFLCCIAFRGVLALETLLNSADVQKTFDSWLHNFLPLPAVVPLIFCVAGALIYLYTFLVFLARRKSGYEI
jgi:hypothetical protein